VVMSDTGTLAGKGSPLESDSRGSNLIAAKVANDARKPRAAFIAETLGGGLGTNRLTSTG
jgi:hypothetical protein